MSHFNYIFRTWKVDTRNVNGVFSCFFFRLFVCLFGIKPTMSLFNWFPNWTLTSTPFLAKCYSAFCVLIAVVLFHAVHWQPNEWNWNGKKKIEIIFLIAFMMNQIKCVRMTELSNVFFERYKFHSFFLHSKSLNRRDTHPCDKESVLWFQKWHTQTAFWILENLLIGYVRSIFAINCYWFITIIINKNGIIEMSFDLFV